MDRVDVTIVPPKKRKPTNVPMGSIFGKWTTLEIPKKHKDRILCKCSCGLEKRVFAGHLIKGASNFCRKFSRHPEVVPYNTRHGYLSNGKLPRVYEIWKMLKLEAKHVGVIPVWLNSFKDFVADVGPAPSKKHRIIRLDTSYGYGPDNFKWVLKSESTKGHPRTIIAKGTRFGRWTTLASGKRTADFILCKCECGIERKVKVQSLVENTSTFCKRWRNHPDIIRKGKFGKKTHGMTGTKEYLAWQSMKQRCLYPGTTISMYRTYMNYGGRGITVFPEWIKSFQSFFDYIGYAPSRDHSLERMDVNGNYEPGNIKWAARVEQDWNRRNSIWLNYQGENKSLREWAIDLGLKPGTIYSRIFNWGWSTEKALSTKVRGVNFRG